MRFRLVAVAALCVACAGPAPEPTLYLLPVDAPEGSERVDPELPIGIGDVVIAPYLDQAGLVVETEAQQVRAARRHRWAEPLGDGLRRMLRAEVSRSLGAYVSSDPSQRPRWSYAVDVDVERLHGTLSGEAMLAASWRVTSPGEGGVVGTYRFAGTQPLPRAGYPGLVDAEIVLLTRLAAAIADSLRNLPPGG